MTKYECLMCKKRISKKYIKEHTYTTVRHEKEVVFLLCNDCAEKHLKKN